MEPKKALDLVSTYLDLFPLITEMGMGEMKSLAKQCALIAVDEIIAADWYIPTSDDYKKWTSYWQQVKHEIENL